MRHIYIFLILLLCFGCSQSEVDTFGGISGTVADEITREPLPGVKVSLTPNGTSQITGSDGNFLFDNLDPQEYTLTFTKDDYVSQSQKVSVKAGAASSVQISMEPIVPILKVTPTKLDFGQEITTLALDITNSGKGTLQWNINEEIPWLTCSPSNGTTIKEFSSVVVSVSRTEMERGNYNGTLVITSNGGSQEIPITMSVESINLRVTPEEADFGSLTNSLQLTLKNTGSGTLKYTVESSNKWLILSKESGSVTQTDYIEAIVSREGLSAGKYNATISFSVSGGSVVVPVKMEVAVNEKPTVSVENATDATYNSAVLHGTMVSVGSSKVTKYGFCWSEQPAPTIEDAHSNLGDCSAPTVFESVANDLKSDTKYYFRAYAENNVGIVYSEKELSFTTTGLPTLPSVTSGAISETTSTTTKANGNITSLGNVSKVTAYGHVWSKTAEPTLQTGKYTNLGEATEPKTFTSEITGLDPHTVYYVRAYATNEKGTAYGDENVFTTSKTDVRLTTSDVTEIVHNAATCGGTVADDGGHSIWERGICWNTKSIPTIDDNRVSVTNTSSASTLASPNIVKLRTEYVTRAEDSFSCRITGLTKETLYYVRAYVKTSDGKVFYGNEKQFTTTEEVSLPTLADLTVSNIQTTSATVISKVESSGNSTITECGFCYSKNAAPTIETGTKVACDPASSELGKNITGLTDGTTYHIRAYAKNAMGIAYSKEAEFTTLTVTVPKLSAVTVENVGRTTAYASATVTETGNATVTECGFCWATSPYPTVYDNKVPCDVGDSFKTKLQELPLLTTVYVRAYVINSKGTGYSDNASFTTTDTDIDIWDGVSVATKFGGGLGTESDPIIINSADQLALLAKNVNSGTTYSGIYFSLNVNLNLNNHKWTPIGKSNGYPFRGSFNGHNHTIEGISINSSDSEQGLFGYIANGNYISNLYIKGAIKGGDKVGGLCGMVYNYETISNCHSSCNVQGTSYIGGLIGYVECDTKITFTLVNSSNHGAVHGTQNIGGIIGYSKCYGYNSGRYANINVANVINKGTIDANQIAGGIIGYLYNHAGTYYGTSHTTLNNCVNYSVVVANSNKGGVVGYASFSDTLALNNTYWLYDIVNNIGLESGFGYMSNYGITNDSLYFMRSDKSCILKNGSDLINVLNQWIDNNSDNTHLKKWKYEIIDNYACPVWDE